MTFLFIYYGKVTQINPWADEGLKWPWFLNLIVLCDIYNFERIILILLSEMYDNVEILCRI